MSVPEHHGIRPERFRTANRAVRDGAEESDQPPGEGACGDKGLAVLFRREGGLPIEPDYMFSLTYSKFARQLGEKIIIAGNHIHRTAKQRPYIILIPRHIAIEGRIAYEPAGENGFGYDPIFYGPLIPRHPRSP